MSSLPIARNLRLANDLREVFEESSGIEIGEGEIDASFVELGFDSLLLTQVALAIQKKTGVKLNFRQLLEDMSTIRTLADHVDRQQPPETAAPPQGAQPAAVAPAAQAVAPHPAAPPPPVPPSAGVVGPSPATFAPLARGNENAGLGTRASGTVLQGIIEQQLQLMARQLAALQGAGPAVSASPRAAVPLVAETPSAPWSIAAGAQVGVPPVAAAPVAAATSAPAAAAAPDRKSVV